MAGEDVKPTEEVKDEATPPKEETPTEDKLIPKARFDEVNQRMKDAEKKLADREAADQKAKKKQLEDEGKLKELNEDLEKRLSASEARSLRLEVAFEKGLAPELVERLKGDTKAELEADAEKLAELVGAPQGDIKRKTTKTGPQSKLTDLIGSDPEEVRKKWQETLGQRS